MCTDREEGGGERSSVHNGKSQGSLGLEEYSEGMAKAEPDPALNIIYIKKEGFKPIFKRGEGIYLPDPN